MIDSNYTIHTQTTKTHGTIVESVHFALERSVPIFLHPTKMLKFLIPELFSEAIPEKHVSICGAAHWGFRSAFFDPAAFCGVDPAAFWRQPIGRGVTHQSGTAATEP